MNKGHTYVRKLTERQKRLAVSYYQKGESVRAVARRFSLDHSSIHSLLKRRSVVCRPHCEANRSCTLNQAAFDTITPESAYWIGFIMADGCISERKYSTYLTVSVAEQDARHLHALRTFLGSSHGIDVCENHGGFHNQQPLHRLSIASKRLTKALSKFGVTPRKSLTARVMGLEHNRDFWRGVVDGNGFLFYRMNAEIRQPIIGLVGSKALIRQFVAFVKHHIDTRSQQRRLKTIWTFRVACSPAVSLARLLYQDCSVSLARKRAVANDFIAS